jgi:hypothetical protein
MFIRNILENQKLHQNYDNYVKPDQVQTPAKKRSQSIKKKN